MKKRVDKTHFGCYNTKALKSKLRQEARYLHISIPYNEDEGNEEEIIPNEDQIPETPVTDETITE